MQHELQDEGLQVYLSEEIIEEWQTDLVQQAREASLLAKKTHIGDHDGALANVSL
jgi:hypothetical protein